MQALRRSIPQNALAFLVAIHFIGQVLERAMAN
jgi:hypothetical protein